jgi:hypothetical protein
MRVSTFDSGTICPEAGAKIAKLKVKAAAAWKIEVFIPLSYLKKCIASIILTE